MSLKMICEEAGVNKGIFNYYFKTKSNFICRVLESFSDEASQNAESEPPAGATSIERLRHFLTTMGRNFRDHRKVALADRGMPGRRYIHKTLSAHRVQTKSKLLPIGKGKFTSDDEIAQRIDMALRGVAPVRERSLHGRQG